MVVVVVVVVVRGGGGGGGGSGMGGGGGGLGCAVERTERGKRFGDAAHHVIDCGYLLP